MKAVTISGMFLVFVTVTGCSYASREDVVALRSELRDVRRVAEESQTTASEARQVAEDSASRTRTIEEAVNRSFKKTMYK